MPERPGQPGRRARALLVALVVSVGGLAAMAPVVAAAPPPPRQVSGDDDVQLPVDGASDPDEVRDEADRILDQDRYQAPDQDRNVLQRIRDWLADRVPDMPSTEVGEGGQDLMGVVTVVVVLALAVGAVTWLALNARRRRGGDDDEVDADVEVEPIRTPREWADEAARAEAAGDHRAAVRARFRATATDLARRDLVADTPGRTAGELRGDVTERAPAAAASFGLLADLFERTWFGTDPAGPDDTADARRLGEQVREQSPRRRAHSDDDDSDGDDGVGP